MKSTPTIGILYPGEMGAAVGAALRSRGLRVVTAPGRSPRTIDRAGQARIEMLGSLAALARECDVVISLVLPGSALSVAEEYLAASGSAPAGAVYIDANSISPERSRIIAAKCHDAGIDYVDGAINGLAKTFRASGTFFLSGARAGEIALLFDGLVRTRVLLDHAPGACSASTIKMLLAGLSKGVCALYAETALVAHRHGMLEEMTAAAGLIYPGIAALADRMLPTYAEHAGRRAQEMRELEQTALDAGVAPVVLSAVRAAHEQLAKLAEQKQLSPARDACEFIESVASSPSSKLSTACPAPAVAGACGHTGRHHGE